MTKQELLNKYRVLAYRVDVLGDAFIDVGKERDNDYLQWWKKESEEVVEALEDLKEIGYTRLATGSDDISVYQRRKVEANAIALIRGALSGKRITRKQEDLNYLVGYLEHNLERTCREYGILNHRLAIIISDVDVVNNTLDLDWKWVACSQGNT